MPRWRYREVIVARGHAFWFEEGDPIMKYLQLVTTAPPGDAGVTGALLMLGKLLSDLGDAEWELVGVNPRPGNTADFALYFKQPAQPGT